MAEILITGSKGFIGTVVRNYIQRGYDEVDHSLGTDHKDVKGRTGTLIYLSSYVREEESYKDPARYLENNLSGLASLLSNNSFSRVIFPSSYAIYDRNGNLEPKSVYGITKLAGEKLIKLYSKNYWILRIANSYGVNSRLSVLYYLKQCKINDKVFTIYKDTGGIYKDFFPVEHIAHTINKVLEGKIKSGTYNVGSGIATNVYEILLRICKGAGIKYTIDDAPQGLSEWFVTEHNLLRSEKEDIETKWLKYLL